jgi:peptidoglycan DL-endopeptidase LytE
MLKSKLCLLLAFTFGAGALAQSYTVKAGDTLYGLARANSMSMAQLAALNSLPANSTLNIGQKLTLSKSKTSSKSVSGSSYTVKAGDTLYGLSLSRNMSMYQLAALNGLSANATLQIGQSLKLSGSPQVQAQRAQTTLRVAAVRSNSYGRVRAASTRYVGIRYVYGGTGRYGLDCSAFTSSVMRDLGVRLPRTARAQYGTGRYVNRSSLREGDLVFFNTLGSGVSHVGIYLGDGMMANANSYVGRVKVESMNTSYWAPRFLGGRRVLG